MRALKLCVWAVLCAGILLSVGCVSKSTSGDITKVGYAWWAPLAWIVGCAVAGLVGWMMLRSADRDWRGGVLCLGALVALVGVMPTTLTNHATVTPEGVRTDTSFFWFAPDKHEVRFEEVSRISFDTQERRGRRGRRITEHFICFNRKNGPTERIELDSLTEQALREMLVAAKAKNIPIDLPAD